MRLLVLVNPGAARAEAALEELATWFRQHCEATFVTTRSHDHLAGALKRHGPTADRIVIGGGDGTISKALPQLLALGKPLAVLPVGTANDFARCLTIPDNTLAAAQIALSGRTHQIDVGLVNETPFLNVASVGVAAQVSEVQSRDLKRRWRLLSYAISLWRVARQARPFHVELGIDGAPAWSGFVYQVSVANGRYHGGGLTVAEHAMIDDERLNVYFVLPGTFAQLFACITHLKFGFPKPEVLHRRSGRHVALRTLKPRPVNADGEIATKTPAEVAILPKALTVLVPPSADLEEQAKTEPALSTLT
jgi:YegS/Rv2252/BmrU family lipid kinase